MNHQLTATVALHARPRRVVVGSEGLWFNLCMARKARQLSFDTKEFAKPSDCFGGSLLKGNNPKCKRPLDSKFPVHLVLRANRSLFRLPKNYKLVADLLYAAAKKHGVSIYKFANVGNHLHLAIRVKRIRRWSAFIRELTGKLALALRKQLGEIKLWKHRPFTRIVRGWKTAFNNLKEYVELNWLEAEGFIKRDQIRSLRHLRAIFDG